MALIIITWHAILDSRTCSTCEALNGRQWVFDVGKDMFDGTLRILGWIAWDLAQGSKAHGHQTYNCRCHISVEFDLEDVLAKCVYLRELAQAYSEPYIPWRGGELAV